MAIQNDQNKKLGIIGIIIISLILVTLNPFILIVFIIFFIKYKRLKNNNTSPDFFDYLKTISKNNNSNSSQNGLSDLADSSNININLMESLPIEISSQLPKQIKLEKRKKYLHIALNNSIEEAREIIQQLPSSDRILIEVGTPMIKRYGTDAIVRIKNMASPWSYIVADNKCADLASREIEMMANAGANASTCLGVAPIETIDSFIDECQKFGIDSMVDMMNVDSPLLVLKKLKKVPDVVILHRGVDEGEFSKEKQIPYYQIKQIKGNYNILVAVAGGDTIKEVQSAIFNDADVVVVWKNFYQASSDTAQLANDFLKEI